MLKRIAFAGERAGEQPHKTAIASSALANHGNARRLANLHHMRRSAIIIVVLLALAAVQIAYYYPQLPATLASHFNAAGAPNSWQPKQAFFAIYGLVTILLVAVYLIVPRVIFMLPPELVNLPNKAYWLSPQRRAETQAFLMDHFATFGAATLTLTIVVFQLAILANIPGNAPSMPPAIWVLLVAYLAFTAIWIIKLFVKFRSA